MPWIPDDLGERSWARRFYPTKTRAPDDDLEDRENPVVKRLLGPDGIPLITKRQRRTVPFGYAKGVRT